MATLQEIEKLKTEQKILEAKADKEEADLSKFIIFTRLNSEPKDAGKLIQAFNLFFANLPTSQS